MDDKGFVKASVGRDVQISSVLTFKKFSKIVIMPNTMAL